jgi:hypothetical protein
MAETKKKTSYTHQEFIEVANKCHNNKYDYSCIEYKTTNSMIDIICHKHREIFRQRAKTHATGSYVPCTKCVIRPGAKTVATSFTINRNAYIAKFGDNYPERDEFIANCIILGEHNGIDHSKFEYEGASYPSIMRCVKHDVIFNITPEEHLGGITKCEKCTKDKFNVDNFIAEGQKIHNNTYKYEYTSPVSGRVPITITCLKCNNVFRMSLVDHVIHKLGCSCTELPDVNNISIYDIIVKYTAERGAIIVSNLDKGCNKFAVITIKCRYDNTWQTTIGKVLSGGWCLCGYCKYKKIGEYITKECLQELLQCDFNDKCLIPSEKLKIDGYNDDLKLAFAYQSRNMLDATLLDERINQFKNDGIVLLFIPKKYKTVAQINSHIVEQLRANNFNMVGLTDIKKIEHRVGMADRSAICLEQPKIYAINNGGVCLSDKFLKMGDDLVFKCGKCETSFTRSWLLISIQKGDTWCKQCSSSTVHGTEIKIVNLTNEELVAGLGGVFVSAVSRKEEGQVKPQKYITFVCKNNHTTEVQIGSLRKAVANGTGGCMQCLKK